MLFVKDREGQYRPAPKNLILAEAHRVSSYQLRRGTKIKIENSECAKSAIQTRIGHKQHEVFACLFLDSGHRILTFKEMFRGSINKAIVHPREVVKDALQLNAAAVIFAHNHPSGDSKPTDQDIELTNTLKDILKVVDVSVLDHLVVGDEVTSMADSGHI